MLETVMMTDDLITVNIQRPVDRGDVLLSLSYLPTAERLILVVVKARNLAWPTTKPIGGN